MIRFVEGGMSDNYMVTFDLDGRPVSHFCRLFAGQPWNVASIRSLLRQVGSTKQGPRIGAPEFKSRRPD